MLRRDALLPLPLGLFSSAEVERLVGVAQVLLEGAFTLGCRVCCRLQDWGFRVVKCCSAFLAFPLVFQLLDGAARMVPERGASPSGKQSRCED